MTTAKVSKRNGKYHPSVHIFTDTVDKISGGFARIADAAVLIACVVSAGNAIIRYLFDSSSNAWLEAQWYLFAVIVMLGAAHTLRRNEHVRVDIVYGNVSHRKKMWIDIIGIIIFLLPVCGIMAYMTWHPFVESYVRGEISGNAGGLLRWPVKLMLPVGFGLLALQGVAELMKRIIALDGETDITPEYERPLQ